MAVRLGSVLVVRSANRGTRIGKQMPMHSAPRKPDERRRCPFCRANAAVPNCYRLPRRIGTPCARRSEDAMSVRLSISREADSGVRAPLTAEKKEGEKQRRQKPSQERPRERPSGLGRRSSRRKNGISGFRRRPTAVQRRTASGRMRLSTGWRQKPSSVHRGPSP